MRGRQRARGAAETTRVRTVPLQQWVLARTRLEHNQFVAFMIVFFPQAIADSLFNNTGFRCRACGTINARAPQSVPQPTASPGAPEAATATATTTTATASTTASTQSEENTEQDTP